MWLLQYLLLKILSSRPTKALQLLGQEKIGFLSISKDGLADGFVFPEESRATLYSSSSYAVRDSSSSSTEYRYAPCGIVSRQFDPDPTSLFALRSNWHL
mgnify:CR=1 FL=1